jgi:hypothetical protein
LGFEVEGFGGGVVVIWEEGDEAVWLGGVDVFGELGLDFVEFGVVRRGEETPVCAAAVVVEAVG